MASLRRSSSALIFSVHDIPLEGIDLDLTVHMGDLYRHDEKEAYRLDGFETQFQAPIRARGSIMKIGTKMDIRGHFHTTYQRACDRCNRETQVPLEGSFDTFLMAKDQFSTHDKPGGKVIHGREGDKATSRHHSRSKAAVLTDAEGEHEDERFGSYDGQTLDLRPLLREYIVLQIPMRVLCEENCEGLCLKCLERIEAHRCACPEGPSAFEKESGNKIFQLQL